MRSPLPSLQGVATWLNSEPKAADLEGRPVIVHFWSLSCYMCHAMVERVNAWRDRYAERGVALISVHQPRSAAELDANAVERDACDEMKMTQPCAIDNEHAIVERFANTFVPGFYVFNRQHELRHFQAGDKGYDRIEAAIERVLEEPSREDRASA